MKYLTTALLIGALSSGGLVLNTAALADEQGMSQMGGHHGMKCWRASLTEEQSTKYAQLKLAFKQKVLPLKAKIKQAKIDLALLVGTDNPNQNAIDKKIDEIAKMKAEKMRLKTAHRIEVRKLLTPEQRVSFDMKLLKKASRDRKGSHHRG